MESEDDKFRDIRPFKDEELLQVKRRLINNELLISTIRHMIWPRGPKFMKKPADFLIRNALRFKLAGLNTIDEFQKQFIGNYLLKWVLDHTTRGLTCSGLETLERDKPHVFISNHRDIVLDSAFIDYLLSENGFPVPYIAFGDNLLINDVISDLIRINKAFIVRRNLPIKEQLKALKHLSEYINLVLDEGNNIWIAQKEGRAKDGIDQTNPAIIKMFHLSERKKLSFADYMRSISVVPVAISYEKDPCDRLKARELCLTKRRGNYGKKKKADFVSMAAGISRDKGAVHVTFAKPLSGEFEDEKAVAGIIDKAIHAGYKLWPRNYIAYDELNKTDKYASFYSAADKREFQAVYETLKPEIRQTLLRIYANPVYKGDGIL